jgi:DNA-binding NtrC family response regulator
VEIRLPALRERREDIPKLAAYFLRRKSQKYPRAPKTFAPDAMQALLEHTWPGNVRELEHVIERAALLAQSDIVGADDLLLRLRPSDSASRLEEMTLEDAERYLIQKALGRTTGNVSDAAKALGLSRSALYRRLQHFGIKGG